MKKAMSLKMEVSYKMSFITLFIYMFVLRVHGQPCSSQTLGEGNLDSVAKAQDGNSNTQYVLTDTIYVSPCCGVVSDWRIYSSGTGDITFEVWRPSGGGSYQLIGQNSKTVATSGEISFGISGTDRISIRQNDVIGFYSSNINTVEHKDSGNEENDNIVETNTLQSSVGDTVSFSTDIDDRTYAISATLSAGDSPTFINLDATVSFNLNSITLGTSVYTVNATDSDVDDTVTLSLVSISPASDFNVQTSDGKVVASTSSLPLETYTIIVRATDACGNTADGTLTVTLFSLPPVINSLPALADISESATDETMLHIVNVTEPDGDFVNCSVSSSVSGPFITKFVYLNGELATGIYLQANPNLNYSVTNSYEITVTCDDPYGNSDAQTLYVYVIQNDVPIITNLQNSTSIVSSTPVYTQIFQVLATDAEGDQTYFSITCTLSTPCPFDIYSTGAIFLSTDLLGTSTYAYELDIVVSDDYSSSGTHRLTVIVTDVNTAPQLSNLPAYVQVNEDIGIGTTVFTVSVYDQDGDTNHAFSSSISPTAGNAYFYLNATTGAVTVTADLNYRTQDISYNLTVDVSDALVTSNSSYLSIDLTKVNSAPVLYQTNYKVDSPEASSGTYLSAIGYNVYDADGDTLTYSFDESNGNITSGFNINDTTGNISFTIDYDIDGGSLSTLLTWLIKISDPEGQSVTATVTLSVYDTNDNVPQFSSRAYTGTTYHDVPVGTTVLTVSASDDDITAANSELEFSTSSTSLFRVDNNGNVFVYSSLLTYANTEDVFSLVVRNPGTTSSDSASVSIYIYDGSSGYFDKGVNIAWVTLTCILAACLLLVIGFLSYKAFKKWSSIPVKQVAPSDTKMPPNTRGTRPSTVWSRRTIITPSDVHVINQEWNAWKTDWYM